jgi:hypothetical protein
MPEHVHLLLNEPERNTFAQAIKSLKQGVARRLALRAEDSFWQARYYDFNVWSERKVCGEAAVHSSESGETRAGRAARGLEVEQFPSLCEWRDWGGRD